MSVVNPLAREISAKVVYYGPGLSGKTTSLAAIHRNVRPDRRGNLISLATEGDRTLYFDLLPIELKKIRDMTVRLQLYTVPGQVFYGATRKLVLEGADAVVFVADSQREAQERNMESMDDLRRNLLDLDTSVTEIPMVLQYNKRDLPDCETVEELRRSLNPMGVPDFETVAASGEGVLEALRSVTAALCDHLAERMKPGNSALQRIAAPEPIISDSSEEEDSLGGALVRMGASLRSPELSEVPSTGNEMGIPTAPPLDSFGPSESPASSRGDREGSQPASSGRTPGRSSAPAAADSIAPGGMPSDRAPRPSERPDSGVPSSARVTPHNQQTVQAPALGQLSFTELFEKPQLVSEIENDIRGGYFAEAVYRATGGVSEILDAVLGTASVETSATRAQLLGLDGHEYLRLRRLGSRPAATISSRDALFALYMLVSANIKAERLEG